MPPVRLVVVTLLTLGTCAACIPPVVIGTIASFYQPTGATARPSVAPTRRPSATPAAAKPSPSAS